MKLDWDQMLGGIKDRRIEALSTYLMMQKRSLKRLHKEWDDKIIEFPKPSMTTLKRWSKRYQWQRHIEMAMQGLTKDRVNTLVKISRY